MRFVSKQDVKSRLIELYHRLEPVPYVGGFIFHSRNMYRRLRGQAPIAGRQRLNVMRGHQHVGYQQPVFSPVQASQEEYDIANAANSVGASRMVVEDLVRRLGIPTESHAVIQKLRIIEADLDKDTDWEKAKTSDDSLMRFEAATHYYSTGQRDEAIKLFESVAFDSKMRQHLFASPAYTQAYLRSVEIVGKQLERQNQIQKAYDLYVRLMDLGASSSELSFRAGRLALKLNRFEDAMALGHGALTSDNNFSNIREPNKHLARFDIG